MLSLLSVVLFLLGFMGCVEVPPNSGLDAPMPPPMAITPGNVFPGLDPGAKDVQSLHFHLYSYGSDRADQISQLAETQYARIMGDTGLYSFQPPGLYSILVYGTKDEFLKKTQQPSWSGGLTIGNAIYTFDSPQLPMILAHEMTHLIFHEYMGSARVDLRWLNEGLAVYEEDAKASELGTGNTGAADLRRQLAAAPMPFDQMTALVPATERDRLVSLWYRQVGDVVRLMVERGGRNGFAQFLKSLRDGAGANEAVKSGFVGTWSGFSDLEGAWKQSLLQ